MRAAGADRFGRLATRLATSGAPPSFGRLAEMSPRGYISPRARLDHDDLRLGRHVLLSEDVVVWRDEDGGSVSLGDRVRVHPGTQIVTGGGGRVEIGTGTSVQPRCLIFAHLAPITIGRDVDIAPNCAFYSYNHGMAPGGAIKHQPIQTKGGIAVGDGAWLGVNATVLSGVRIGEGAVVGAGAVVTRDVPDGAIAVGNPARVVGHRADKTAAAAANGSPA